MKFRSILVVLCALAAKAGADTISVAGVVVRAETGLRAPSERVAIYTSKEADPRGKLGEDSTSKRGVYSIVVKNVGPGVRTLWVVIEGKDAIADPQQVDLTTGNDDLRLAKADDLTLQALPKIGQTITPEQAGKLIAARAASNAVRVKAGVISEEASEQHLAKFSAQLRSPLQIKPGEDDGLKVTVANLAVKEVQNSVGKSANAPSDTAKKAAYNVRVEAARVVQKICRPGGFL